MNGEDMDDEDIEAMGDEESIEDEGDSDDEDEDDDDEDEDDGEVLGVSGEESLFLVLQFSPLMGPIYDDK